VKPATAHKVARAISAGCREAGWEVDPIFRHSESDNEVEQAEGDEIEVFFVVDIGDRAFTITVTDETLANEIRRIDAMR
jgi:hypothetical protein